MNELRYFSADQVKDALSMRDAIEAMAIAFAELSAGRVAMPQRSVVKATRGGAMLVMSGCCNVRYGLGAKIVSVFPGNRERGSSPVQAVVVLLDDETGAPAALIDGESLTSIRTGAASGLATDLLSRPDSTAVAIIGAGIQARSQLEAVCCVRAVKTVSISSRSDASAHKMVQDLASVAWLHGADVMHVRSVREAVGAADIVCVATNSPDPVFPADAVKRGTHINAVGSFTREMRELDPSLLPAAYVVVDHRPAARAEAGEIIAALEEGWIEERNLVELGEIVSGAASGRETPDQITVFKSVGVAVQDLVAGARVVSSDA